jgi:hypothetical protein
VKRAPRAHEQVSDGKLTVTGFSHYFQDYGTCHTLAQVKFAPADKVFAGATYTQVRKTPSWPRSWGNLSLLYLY